MRVRSRLCVTACALLAAPAAHAAGDPTAFDPSFGAAGRTVLAPFSAGSQDQLAGEAFGADGSIVLAGLTTPASGPSRIAVAHVLPSGQPDPAWNGNGEATGPPASSVVAVQQNHAAGDGTFVVAFTTDGTPSRFGLAKFTRSGTLDTSFDAGGPTPGVLVFPSYYPADAAHQPVNTATSLFAQQDGTIVEAGWVNPGGTSTHDRIAVAEANWSTGQPVAAFTDAGAPAGSGERVVPPTSPDQDERADAVYVDNGSGSIYLAAEPSLVEDLTSAGALNNFFGTDGRIAIPPFEAGSTDVPHAIAQELDVVAGFTVRHVSGGSAIGLAAIGEGGGLSIGALNGFGGKGQIVLPAFPGSVGDTDPVLEAEGVDHSTYAVATVNVGGADHVGIAFVNSLGDPYPGFGSSTGEVVLPSFATGSSDSPAAFAEQPLPGFSHQIVGATSAIAGEKRFAVARLGVYGATAPPPVSTPRPTPLVLPALGSLSLHPSAFRAARSGPSIAASRGATVSYTDSLAARTTLTVLARRVGAKRGHRCVTRTRRLAHAKRCTLYVSRGTFSHADKAGRNSFRFTGRLHGHALAPGRYRLSALPRASGRTGRPRTASFTIKR